MAGSVAGLLVLGMLLLLVSRADGCAAQRAAVEPDDEALATETLHRFYYDNHLSMNLLLLTQAQFDTPDGARLLDALRVSARQARGLAPRSVKAALAVGEVEHQFCSLKGDEAACAAASDALWQVVQKGDAWDQFLAARSLTWLLENRAWSNGEPSTAVDEQRWEAAAVRWRDRSPPRHLHWALRALARKRVWDEATRPTGSPDRAIELLIESSLAANAGAETMEELNKILHRNARSAGALLCPREGTERASDSLSGSYPAIHFWHACGYAAIGEPDLAADKRDKAEMSLRDSPAPAASPGECRLPEDRDAAMTQCRQAAVREVHAPPDAGR